MRGDWKVITDNFVVKIRGEGLNECDFVEARETLAEPEFWENDKLWAEVAEALPSYRLSKFQSLMPLWIQREVIARYLLDIDGARLWHVQGEGRKDQAVRRGL